MELEQTAHRRPGSDPDHAGFLTETILLVEDEEEVRALARELLEMDGYPILEALSPEEALRLGAEHPASLSDAVGRALDAPSR